MDKFRVVVWCEACRGDDEGCFGGKAQVIGAEFENRDEAERAGAHYCTDLPYQYRVEGAEEVIEIRTEARQASRISSRSWPSASFSVF